MMPESKTYLVTMMDETKLTITADQVNYDDVGNLMFLNFKKTIQTPNNPSGELPELVKCINGRCYKSYELKNEKGSVLQ